MRLTKKLASVGSTVLLTATFGLVAAPAAHAAVAPLDPTKWTVTCDSVVGTIKFATAINLGASTTDNTITVKVTTSGCQVPEVDGAPIAPGVNGPGPAQGTGDPYSCVAANPLSKHVTDGIGGTTTLGSPNISTTTAGSFVAADVGQFITGLGIPPNTLVSSIGGGGTTAVLSQNATANSTVPPKTKFTLGLGVPNQPCVNLAPAKITANLISKAGHNNHYNTSADGHTTSGSKNISCATCHINALEVGNGIVGTGIPSGDTIAQVTQADFVTACSTGCTHAVLATAATLTNTNVDFTHPDSSGCLGLQGLSTGTSGSEIVAMKNQSKGLDNITALPKLLDPTDANITGTVSSTLGVTFSAPWGTSYGAFQVGAAFTNEAGPARTTGAFRGNDNGAGDLFEGTTGESDGAILIQCLGKGVKGLSFGIGHTAFG